LGLTITEKIIRRAGGKKTISPGEIVTLRVDKLMLNDFVGAIVFNQFESLGVGKVWDPDRVLFAADHRIPPTEVKWAEHLKSCREYCRKYGITRFGEIGRHGICHQLMCEGFVLPGEVALGTDSHATMYGGLGAFSCGITSSDAAVIMATGEIWIQVPASVRFDISGHLSRFVTAKDIALKMLTVAPLEEFSYKAVEVEGETIRNLSVGGRLVICNMIAEMDAKNGIIAADGITSKYFNGEAGNDAPEQSDPDATYEKIYKLNVRDMNPLVACPHEANNVKEVREVRGKRIHQAFLGSCTNGRVEDLQQAAEILKGKKVHPDIRMLVVPASQKVFTEATRLGIISVFLEAGAAVLTPCCSACAGSGSGIIAAGETCISTTNRNFKGRMGSPNSEVYLASAYTVAASAVAGVIEDPRQFI
jgi:homoaconitate hydratase family protein